GAPHRDARIVGMTAADDAGRRQRRRVVDVRRAFEEELLLDVAEGLHEVAGEEDVVVGGITRRRILRDRTRDGRIRDRGGPIDLQPRGGDAERDDLETRERSTLHLEILRLHLVWRSASPSARWTGG